MSESTIPRGVLDKTYAAGRRDKAHLVFRYKVRARIVADAIKSHVGTSGSFRLLDLGSAEGLTLLELNSSLPLGTYVGVEYNGELVRCAPELPSNIRLVTGDVTHLPEGIQDTPFDIVSALAVLEHLAEPDKAVAEAARSLRQGGLFVATCPNPFWDAVAARLGLLQGIDHVTDMNKDRMIRIAEKAGMEVLSFERFMWAPVGVLTYLQVPVSPSYSLKLDRRIRRVRIFDWLFANQYVIARRNS